MKSNTISPERGSDFDPAKSLGEALSETPDPVDEAMQAHRKIPVIQISSDGRLDIDLTRAETNTPIERERARLSPEQINRRRKNVRRAAGTLVLAGMGLLTNAWGPDRGSSDEIKLPAPIPVTASSFGVEQVEGESSVGSGAEVRTSQAEVSSNTNLSVPKVFEDPRAEQVLVDFGMDARDFLIGRESVFNRIAEKSHWAEDDEMLPGFLPSIYDHEASILAASDENNVSPNALAIYITIETHGYEDAVNHIPAIGLGQHTSWMIDNYKALGFMPDTASREDFLAAWKGEPSNHSKDFYQEIMLDPDNNIRVTARHLSDLQRQVLRDNPDMTINDPRLYSQMGLLYNGGGRQYNANEKDRAFESRNYADSVEFLTMQNAIASQLRAEGLNDWEIEEAITNLTDGFFSIMYAIRHIDVNDTHDTDERLAGLHDIVAYLQGESIEDVEEAVELYESGQANLRDFTEAGNVYQGEFQEFFAPGYWTVAQRAGNSLYLAAQNA